MALPGRPASVPPFHPPTGSTSTAATLDDLNRLVTDLNVQLDAVWAALTALDTRLVALEPHP